MQLETLTNQHLHNFGFEYPFFYLEKSPCVCQIDDKLLFLQVDIIMIAKYN